IRKSKSGKPRDVVLTNEGQEFFKQVCAGRARDEIMLRRDNGAPWGNSNQQFPMQRACAPAKIPSGSGLPPKNRGLAKHMLEAEESRREGIRGEGFQGGSWVRASGMANEDI